MRQDDDLSYFESSEFKKILARYEAAKEDGAALYMDADELTDVAEYYAMVCHDDERAAVVIDEALQLHPDAVDPQIFRARKKMLDGDTRTAELMCDAIEDQTHREVIFLRAELMIRQDKNADALDYLQETAETVEEDLDYFYYDSAYIFIDYEDYSSALKLSEELEEIAPKWFKTWQVRADVLLAQENYEAANTYIEQLLNVDPFYVEAWNWSCEAHCGMMEFDKAIESSDYALAVDPQNERAMQLKAWALMQVPNYESAHEIYQQLQHMNPSFGLNYMYDSICLSDQGKMDEALKMVEKAEELSDERSIVQHGMIEQHIHILTELHDTQNALRLVDVLEKRSEENEVQFDHNFMRARIYAVSHQLEKAVEYLNVCADKYPSELPYVYYQSGQICFDSGYYMLAKDYFNLLLNATYGKTETPPSNDDIPRISEEYLHANAYAYLAACCLELREYDASMEYMRNAVNQDATNLRELFENVLPEGIPADDLLDYYYYHLYGAWPIDSDHSSDMDLPF